MTEQIQKKIRSGKGAAEILSFAVSCVLLLAVFLSVISLISSEYALETLETTCMGAARKAVVCESKAEAEKTVNRYVREALKDSTAFMSDTVNTYIDYTDGDGWTKGSFITVTISATTKTLSSWLPRQRTASVVVMIE